MSIQCRTFHLSPYLMCIYKIYYDYQIINTLNHFFSQIVLLKNCIDQSSNLDLVYFKPEPRRMIHTFGARDLRQTALSYKGWLVH